MPLPSDGGDGLIEATSNVNCASAVWAFALPHAKSINTVPTLALIINRTSMRRLLDAIVLQKVPALRYGRSSTRPTTSQDSGRRPSGDSHPSRAVTVERFDIGAQAPARQPPPKSPPRSA